MKIVIAGNYEQYLQYLKESGYTPRQARYIERPEQLRGLRETIEIVRVGTWRDSAMAKHLDNYRKDNDGA